jgi:DNA repair exonuclease SbcCD nuclease subunit
MGNYLSRGAFLTDIHFGRKNNSDLHNQDCLDFIDWFCENVKNDPTIDYVAFLGDWHESRPSIGATTLMYSYMGAKKLNSLGLPVFFVVGNHDLANRNDRDIFSTIHFNEFNNFRVIDKPVVVDDMKGGMLFAPFLFHEEYPGLSEYKKVPLWAGHFEFKGFAITGSGMKMEAAPDPKDFTGPKYIFSGHFHKRQEAGNVIYMGNTFPMDYGDMDDNDRGMMVYDHGKNKPTFINWKECPKYTRIKISDLLDGNVTLDPKMRVTCLSDIPLTYEEEVILKDKFMQNYGLREFSLTELADTNDALSGTETTIEGDERNVDQVFETMLMEINVPSIQPEMLIQIYRDLKVPR